MGAFYRRKRAVFGGTPEPGGAPNFRAGSATPLWVTVPAAATRNVWHRTLHIASASAATLEWGAACRSEREPASIAAWRALSRARHRRMGP